VNLNLSLYIIMCTGVCYTMGHKMNNTDALLKTPFSSLNSEGKLHIKKLSAHQPTDFKLEQSGKDQKRSCSSSWFDKRSCLSVRKRKNHHSFVSCVFCLVGIRAGHYQVLKI
jgi:hypothetical protein